MSSSACAERVKLHKSGTGGVVGFVFGLWIHTALVVVSPWLRNESDWFKGFYQAFSGLSTGLGVFAGLALLVFGFADLYYWNRAPSLGAHRQQRSARYGDDA